MVVVGVVDMMMSFVEMLCMIVTLYVVMMFHDLSAVVFAMVVVVVVVCTMVPGVVGVPMLQGDVHRGTFVERPFVHQVAVGTLVVAVVEVADKCQRHMSDLVLIRHQHHSLLTVDVQAVHVSLKVKLHATNNDCH